MTKGLAVVSVLLAALAALGIARAGFAAHRLGPAPTPCASTSVACCPPQPANCQGAAHTSRTRLGEPVISRHLIHAGERFTIRYVLHESDDAGWTFPAIARKVSRCRDGVDLSCTYLARDRDATFPGFADYFGWTHYPYSIGSRAGLGVGNDYYAIVGHGDAITGRLAFGNGKAVPRGGFTLPSGGSDPGVNVRFTVRRHGIDRILYTAAPGHVHTGARRRNDIGYYGALVKPGRYRISAGDPQQGITCRAKHGVLMVRRDLTNVDFVCRRGA